MKKLFFLKKVTLNLFQGLMVSIFILLLTNTAYTFDSGSTGALGAFNPQTNIEVDISLYPDGKLNYTTVNIPSGVTVTFKKNSANTPVYILATGDVTIDGTISVNGTNGSGIYPGKGGPGGFDGGLGGTPAGGGNPALPGGKGLGAGGGNQGSTSSSVNYCAGSGGGGGFGYSGSNGSGVGSFSSGGAGGGTYGNIKILPMIGGSGGGGGGGSNASSYQSTGGSGGGGGGAILIASSGTITVTGSITAKGGNGGSTSGSYASGGSGGSGGAIKLMAGAIDGDGTISASGGAGGGITNCYAGVTGGSGRIRFEADTVTRTASTTPPYTYSYPGTVFVTNIPTLSITSVGGVNVPANPTGQYGLPDLTLPSTTTNPVTVNISAANIPTGTQVTVTAVPEYDTATSASGTLSGTDASSTASASITLSTQYQSILTATATFTVQVAMYWDDEKIEKVRVAATMGKGSEVVYITEKGREIKAGELMAKLMGR